MEFWCGFRMILTTGIILGLIVCVSSILDIKFIWSFFLERKSFSNIGLCMLNAFILLILSAALSFISVDFIKDQVE